LHMIFDFAAVVLLSPSLGKFRAYEVVHGKFSRILS
jgi:hypothetical protein